MTPSRKDNRTRSVFDVRAEKIEISKRSLKNLLHGKNILNLRPRFTRRHPWLSAGIFVVLAATLFWGIEKLSTRAEVSDFFPLTCLGSWQNPSNAQGKPESLGATSTDLTADNASVFDPTVSSSRIFCGAFIPSDYQAQGDIKNVSISLLWNMPGYGASSSLPATDGSVAVPTSTPPASTTSPTDATTTVPATGTSENFILKQFASFFGTAYADTTDTASTVPTSSDANANAASNASAASTSASSTDSSQTPTTTISAATTTTTTTTAATTTATATSTATATTTSDTMINISTSTDTITGAPATDNNFLEVSYSLDGTAWIDLAKVSPDNWQNFTATLPIANWDDLKNLQIRIQRIPTALQQIPTVYLDGMFIEVHYEIPPALPLFLGADNSTTSTTPPPASGPTIIVLPPAAEPVPVNQNNDFKANESPTFDFNLNALPAPSSPQSSISPLPPAPPPATTTPSSTSMNFSASPLSFFFRWLTAHAQSLPGSSQLPDANNPILAQIFGPDGKLTNLQPATTIAGGNLRVTLPSSGRAFKPGEYHMKLLIWQNGTIYQTESSFTWGVLAVNFNKSIYKIGDTAKIGLGFLNPGGHTICGGNITMNVSSPSGRVYYFSTRDKTILRSPYCAMQSYTNIPDYSAAFIAQDGGTYRVAVSAEDPLTGNVVTTNDSFGAQANPQFSVERVEATRIYPPRTYQATIKIVPNADYAGIATEVVPSGFSVTTDAPTVKTINGEDQMITWQVSFKKGTESDLTYSFKAPDVSPELYKLGPLTIGSWQEVRQWQIAADATAITLVATSTPCGTSSTPSTTITCNVSNLPRTAGDDLIAIIGTRSSSTVVVSSISGATPAWTRDVSIATSSTANSTDIWSSINITNASATMKITLTQAFVGEAVIAEYSGIYTSPDDKNATSSGTAVNPAKTGTTAATTQANELWVGGLTDTDARRTFSTPTGGFTLESTYATGSTTGGINIGFVDKIVSATGTASSSLNMSTAVVNTGAIQTYKGFPTITIADGTQPANMTIGPGAAATSSAQFTLQTNAGTSSITSVNVSITSSTGVFQVQITNSTGATVYGSSTNPSSSALTINTTNMNVSTTATTFLTRIQPLSATNMPVPPGGTYTVSSTVTGWADSQNFNQAGTNTTSSIITIDNQSPNDVTNASGTAGSAQVQLSWTVSDSNTATTTVLRGTSTIATVPTEGVYYTASTTLGTTTVACVVASSTQNCTDIGVTNGVTYYYQIFEADKYLNYSLGTSTTNGPFTPSTVSCGISTSTTAFGTVSSAAVATSSPNVSSSITCNDSLGCILDINDNGNGSSPGLATSSPAYLIPSTTTTLIAGTEGYGIQAATTSAGSGNVLIINPTYLKTGNDVGGLSRSATVVASSTNTFTGREVIVSHLVSVSNSTQAGDYTDTITYSCFGN